MSGVTGEPLYLQRLLRSERTRTGYINTVKCAAGEPRTFLPVWSFSYPLLVKSVVTLHRLMDWLELVTRLRIKSVGSFSVSRRAASFLSLDLEQTHFSGLLLVSYE